ITPAKLMAPRGLTFAAMLLVVAACAAPPGSPDASAGFITVASQPANVGDAKIKALAYHDSGEYERDLGIVADKAADCLRTRPPAASRPALVLDVDETSLSNWEILKRDDFGRPVAGPCDVTALDAPCGWAAWDLLGRDPAIGPTLRVFQLARSLDV